MHKLEFKILELFKKKPNKVFSTSEILSLVFPKEHNSIMEDLKSTDFSDRDKINCAKRLKGQLHRRLLHHLNKLIKEKILVISKQGNKGQKFFTLNLESGQEFTIGKTRKIVISKPDMPAMPIEGLENKRILYRYELGTWISRMNSILLDCRRFNINKLSAVVQQTFSNVNDCICLDDFGHIIKQEGALELISMLDNEATNYGREISLTFKMSEIDNPELLKRFIRDFFQMAPQNINIVLNLSSKDMTKSPELLRSIISLYIDAKKNLVIKNDDAHRAPCFMGKIGPYTFYDSDWEVFEKTVKDHVFGLACSQSTIIIDVYRFFREFNSKKKFRGMIMNIVKTLMSANSIQRKNSEEYFKNLNTLNKPHMKDFFMFSNNYIRFWNYGWKQPSLDQDYVIDLIKSTKDDVIEFCSAQETIYKSCGIPTRFKVAFSCATEQYDYLSKREFKRTIINSPEDLNSPQITSQLKDKERITRIFDGGDIASIHRRGDIDPEDVFRELSILLSNYKIPLLSYRFGHRRDGNLKLTTFIWSQ